VKVKHCLGERKGRLAEEGNYGTGRTRGVRVHHCRERGNQEKIRRETKDRGLRWDKWRKGGRKVVRQERKRQGRNEKVMWVIGRKGRPNLRGCDRIC
jgi:hypothetical protein